MARSAALLALPVSDSAEPGNERLEHGFNPSSSTVSSGPTSRRSDNEALAQPSFPVLRLPYELQLMVFIEAMEEVISTPGVQFVNGKVCWEDPVKTRWSCDWMPDYMARDNSHIRRIFDLGGICDAAEEAHRIMLRKYGHFLWRQDILCLKTPGFYGFSSNSDTPPTAQAASGIYFHPLSQSPARTVDYPALQEANRRFRRVGITYRDFTMDASAPFSCARQAHCLRPDHMTWRESDLCHAELAGFIDCFPKIKEFFLVLGVRKVPGKSPSNKHKVWEQDRIRNPVQPLFTYHGRQTLYHEVHKTQVKPRTYGVLRNGTRTTFPPDECACPVAPRCHEPPGVDTDDAFELLRRTRKSLLNRAVTGWKLSLRRRRAIQFKVLVQGLPTSMQ